EAGATACLRVAVVDLEGDDPGADVLEVRGRRAANGHDDLGLLLADVDAIANQRERPVLERSLVPVEVPDRRQGRGLDRRPLRRRRSTEHDDALVMLLRELELAVPGRVRMCGARDVV